MMFRNHLKIAVRQLWRNQLFSLLNITGLTVGLAVSMFIALYVWHEFHYDRFQPFADRTYRILSASKFGDNEVTMTGMHESFGREAGRELPEVEQFARFSGGRGPTLLQAGQNRFNEQDVRFADASMLTVMGYPMVWGNARTALAEPGRIVLTRQLAEKYFFGQNPIGQTVVYDKKYPLTVSGVVDDLPTNSVVQFSALVSLSSMPTLGPQRRDMYEHTGFLETFLVLRPGSDVALAGKKWRRSTRASSSPICPQKSTSNR